MKAVGLTPSGSHAAAICKLAVWLAVPEPASTRLEKRTMHLSTRYSRKREVMSLVTTSDSFGRACAVTPPATRVTATGCPDRRRTMPVSALPIRRGTRRGYRRYARRRNIARKRGSVGSVVLVAERTSDAPEVWREVRDGEGNAPARKLPSSESRVSHWL